MHSLAVSLGRQALVLKEFKINLSGDEYVYIVARKAGFISWILTLLGVDATTVFRVYADRIEFQEGSLSGQINTVLPLHSISIASCGYMKPVLLLVYAIISLLLAIPTFGIMLHAIPTFGIMHLAIPTFGITLILAIIFFISYFLNKNLLISVISNSSWPIVLCFKRSVIEGVKIEYEQAQQVIQIINQLLMIEASK